MTVPSPVSTIPAGLRLYAIGDIHGRRDLLDALLLKIDADHTARGIDAELQLVFLGDYIDRGLNSRGVIDKLIDLQTAQQPATTCLLGNHDQVLRKILNNGDTQLAAQWLTFGGREAGLSYGVMPPRGTSPVELADYVAKLQTAIPEAHRAFFDTLHTSLTIGDYFFCHAGIRPGLPLSAQSEDDLVWSRAIFIPSTAQHEKIIVHGHTIVGAPETHPNRIAVDTGAYATGALTALALEKDQQWFIQT